MNDEAIEKSPGVSIEEAAQRMGKSPQFVRTALQQGRAPFGFAARTGKNRFNYFISRKQFEEYVGE